MEGKIGSSSGKEIQVRFSVRAFSADEKRRNALKGLGLFWGLALASAPLPPIHWVTAPGFFLFGIYWGLRKLKEAETFESFTYPCPECGKEATVEAQVARNPLAFVCPHCRYGLKLSWQ